MSGRKRRNVTEIQALIEEVIVTSRQLRLTSVEVHGNGGLMPGQRGVLFDLARMGPQTVAGLARARGISRQHIQALINRFHARGLIQLAENPAHRRSNLVVLTREGEALVKIMVERESDFFGSLELAIPASAISTAARVLRELRQHLAHRLAMSSRGGARPHHHGRRRAGQ